MNMHAPHMHAVIGCVQRVIKSSHDCIKSDIFMPPRPCQGTL